MIPTEHINREFKESKELNEYYQKEIERLERQLKVEKDANIVHINTILKLKSDVKYWYDMFEVSESENV